MRAIHLITEKNYNTALQENQVISTDFYHFSIKFRILVVEKRHAINEHYVPDRNGQPGAQSENGEFYLLTYIVADRTKKNRRLQTMKKGENIFKRKDGRWEARYSKGCRNCPAKSSFVTVKPARRHKKKSRTAPAHTYQRDTNVGKEIECPHPTLRLVKNTRYGAGDRTRTGTLSPAVDFELFAPHGTQTNSAPCGGPLTDTKSLANTTVFEADVQKKLRFVCHFRSVQFDGNFGF